MSLSSDERGLDTAEAHRRLQQVGKNEPAAVRTTPILLQVLLLFSNPLALVLIGAAIVSAVVGEAVSAGIIIVVVLLGAGINFTQTFRSQRAVQRLREGVAPTATVQRDGEWHELPRGEIVPGDLIRLCAGDLVPGDSRLLSARDLHVQQAALTGESFPVEKAPTTTKDQAPLRLDDPGVVFLGSSVVSGTATARVVATGPRTAFGEIAARLGHRPPETEFERGTRQFGLFITQTVVVLVFFVFLVSAIDRRDPLESLLFAIALAVGLTPEFLPVIIAVTLAKGAVLMARRKVVVKHIAAIQNFGSMDILCSDKTGTLTRGKMELLKWLDPFGVPSDRALLLAYLNSVYETGVKSPLDAAILRHQAPDIAGYRKLDEVPFDFERRRLSVVVEGPTGRLLVSKGAPEGVVECCTSYESENCNSPLDSVARARFVSTYEGLSRQGFRLLAVAYKSVAEKDAYRVSDEADLILVGILAFLDPPRDDAAASVRALKRDGVKVKVLTGDNDLVCRHVCEQVGLDGSRVVVGTELEHTTDGALGHVAEQADVFARLSPAQKTRVILALKARGHVVGYLGDGINDAPSLHAADVGISVSSAVDVAKDAAEIILLEPGLSVLHRGILEGRQAFGNVMKYLLMETSSNFGNMFSMAAATVFLPFLPMLPFQVLLNGLLYNITQLAIPTDRVDASYIHKPHRWDISVIRRFMLIIGPVSSLFDFLTFFVLLQVFRASAELFHTGWFVESLATQTLVVFIIRTGGNPFRSRPSRPLALTVGAVVVAGIILPYSPLAGWFGFVPLPIAYLLFVALATAMYLTLVEVVKRLVLKRAFR